MSSTKTLLVGGLAAGVALLLIGGLASASSSSSKSTAPKPGPGATVEKLPAGSGPGLPALKRTTWRVPADASGQQAGVMILLQSASNANDWALVFSNDQTHASGVLAFSQTPVGGLIAQQLSAGIAG